jgi:hypothetical protein
MQVFDVLSCVYFLFAIIQFSNQINYSKVEKVLGGDLPPSPPPSQVTPMISLKDILN